MALEEEEVLYCSLVRALETLKKRHTLSNAAVNVGLASIRSANRHWAKSQYVALDFSNVAACCAYLKRYATCHAALTMCATQWFLKQISNEIRTSLFQTESLSVVFAGGGPGNDLLGFCSAIKNTNRNFKSLDVTVLDMERGWEEVFNEVALETRVTYFSEVAQNHLAEDELRMNCKFVQCDLLTQTSIEMQEADVILMVKVLSRVNPSKRIEMMNNVFSTMKNGSILLFVDGATSKARKCAKLRSDVDLLFAQKSRYHRLSFRKKDLLNNSLYGICVFRKNECPSVDSLLIAEDKKNECPSFCSLVITEDQQNECPSVDSLLIIEDQKNECLSLDSLLITEDQQSECLSLDSLLITEDKKNECLSLDSLLITED